jgi:hypothetical protein
MGTGRVVGADGADVAEGDRVGMAVADMPAMPSVAAPLSLVMLLPWLLVVNETVLLIPGGRIRSLTRARIRMITSSPGATRPTATMTVRPWLDTAPRVLVPSMTSSASGIGSVTTTSFAVPGPLFVTVIVNMTTSPMPASDGSTALVIAGSALPDPEPLGGGTSVLVGDGATAVLVGDGATAVLVGEGGMAVRVGEGGTAVRVHVGGTGTWVKLARPVAYTWTSACMIHMRLSIAVSARRQHDFFSLFIYSLAILLV